MKDLNIRLTFPAGVVIDPNDYTLSDKAIGYEVTICEAEDSISIIEEGAKLWDFTMIGGTIEPATHVLLSFNVYLPDTIDTGHRHQVKINQISMTMADGTAVTARTRNGLIGIFKPGDANFDDDVDGQDARLIVNDWLGTGEEELDMNIADIVNDGVLDGQDTRAIINVWLNAGSENNTPQNTRKKLTKNYKVL